MKALRQLTLASLFIGGGIAMAQPDQPCYLSTEDNIGLLTCADGNGDYTPLVPVKILNAEQAEEGYTFKTDSG
jgi:hypothetical protein